MDILYKRIITGCFVVLLYASVPFRHAEGAIFLAFRDEYRPSLTAATTPHHPFAAKFELQAGEEIVIIKKAELHRELVPICACESTGTKYGTPRHFKKDGSVLRGEITSDDIGLCQINRYFHGVRAESMGIDLFSREGNIEYANYLYEREGTGPWLASKHCWGGPAAKNITLK